MPISKLFRIKLPYFRWNVLSQTSCHHILPKIKIGEYRSKYHISTRLKAKMFVDKENQYAHEIMGKSSLYKMFTEAKIIHADNLENQVEEILNRESRRNVNETFENFKRVTSICKICNFCITDEKFDKFVNEFTSVCHEFTDEQLIESLKYLLLLPETPSVRSRNFVELWMAIDSACVKRVEKWSIDELLLVSDHWYVTSLGRNCEFIWEALRKIGRKAKKLTPQQLVHTMFLCNITRKSLFDMIDLEMRFADCIDGLSIKEIGVVAMGFFKTKTRFLDPKLVEVVYRRLMPECNTVEDITLVNLLKILRYSSKIQHEESMRKLLDKLCPEIERLSLTSCLHIALLGCDISLCHDQILELIINKFNKNIKQSRLKDMERISHVMSLLSVRTVNGGEKELCQNILLEIKDRVEEIVRYPRCFPTCLHFLTLCGFYDAELISTVLDQNFIKHAYGRNMLLGKEIFCLDSFAQINLKGQYSGNLLQDRQRRTMGKCLSKYIPERNSPYRLNATDRVLLEIKETCENLYRKSVLKHVLPHFERADVLLIYNKTEQKPLSVSSNCPPDYSGSILKRSDLLDEDRPEVNTVVLVAAGWNHFVRNTERLTGLVEIKLKQLELLGHNPVVIPWFVWREMETERDRQDYIKRRLSPYT